MLEVKNLVKSFGNNKAVNDVSFSVQEGRIFGLLGRNGAGKSTIFRMILNILKPDSGMILYHGNQIQESAMDKIGYLPEEGSLIASYTVLEQSLYYGALKSMTEEEVRQKLIFWLKKFNILEYMNIKIKSLSKGNRQKIQFIIAVLHDPDLLILDEPFSGLDPISVEQLKNAILELKKQNKTIIFSSHRMDHVEILCEDILILDKGDTILSGDLEKIKLEDKKQDITVVGQIHEEIITKMKQIKGVMSIENHNSDTYVIKVDRQECIKELLKILQDSEITNFYTSQISLNDIFIDRVGKSYEEE